MSLNMRLMSRFDLILSSSMAKSLLLVLFWFTCLVYTHAERDFNFNESQVPILEPRDDPAHTHFSHEPYSVEVSACRSANSEIVLSLVLKNHDWTDLSDNKKDKVLDKLSKFFAIPKEFIVMESVTKGELNEMQKESIRRGHNKCHSKHNHPLGRVSFVLGCGSTYFTIGEPINKQIGAQMKDGSIDNITGVKFGWWVIWHKHYKMRAQRKRRQTDGSGTDETEDDYDYEDDEDEEESESVTEVPATTTHAHRHHHGIEQTNIFNKKLEISSPSSSTSTSINQIVDSVIGTKVETDEAPTVAVASSSVKQSSLNGDSNFLMPDKNGAIDEEIVESVSRLESVITKTIENTKNIKELPAIEEGDVEEGDVPVAVEIEKEVDVPNVLDEVDESNILDLNLSIKDNQLLPSSVGYESITSDTTTQMSKILHEQKKKYNNNDNDSLGVPNTIITDDKAKHESIALINTNIKEYNWARIDDETTNLTDTSDVNKAKELHLSSVFEVDISSASVTLSPYPFVSSNTTKDPFFTGVSRDDTTSFLPSITSSINAANTTTPTTPSTAISELSPLVSFSSSSSLSSSTVSAIYQSSTTIVPLSLSSTTTASLTTTIPFIITPLLTKQEQIQQQVYHQQKFNQPTKTLENFETSSLTPFIWDVSEYIVKDASRTVPNVLSMYVTPESSAMNINTTTEIIVQNENDVFARGVSIASATLAETTLPTTTVFRVVNKVKIS